MNTEISSLAAELYNWQTLIGAVIGAMGGFAVWMVSLLYSSVQQKSEHRQFMIKLAGMAALTAADAHSAISDFLSGRLTVLRNEAAKQVGSSSYFLGSTFFPILSFQPLDFDVLKLGTGSGYVDGKFLQIVKRSIDIGDTIIDIKRQFEASISSNRELALLQKNPPILQNQQFKEDLDNFYNVTTAEIIEHNIPLYVKEIVELQVALRELESTGLFLWRLKFGPAFKFFHNRKQMGEYLVSATQRIDYFLAKKFQARFDEINSGGFNPPLKQVTWTAK